MDNLASIRMFVRVADAGSFTAAAHQLDVAVSSVSRQINALEDDLNVRAVPGIIKIFYQSIQYLSVVSLFS